MEQSYRIVIELCITNQAGDVLLVKPRDHRSGWMFPSRTLSPGDTILTAAYGMVGELVDCELLELTAHHMFLPGDTELPALHVVFAVTLGLSHFTSHTPPAYLAHRWLSREELGDVTVAPRVRRNFNKRELTDDEVYAIDGPLYKEDMPRIGFASSHVRTSCEVLPPRARKR